MVLLPSIAPADENDRLGRYSYEETKRLVSFVEDAATLIEQKGEFAFQDFGVPGSKWLSDDYYVFVYTPDGVNAFHPVEAQLDRTQSAGSARHERQTGRSDDHGRRQ